MEGIFFHHLAQLYLSSQNKCNQSQFAPLSSLLLIFNLWFIDVICTLYRVALNQKRNPSLFGRMDELGFYVPSTIFQSFRDDERMNMKGSVQ